MQVVVKTASERPTIFDNYGPGQQAELHIEYFSGTVSIWPRPQLN